MVPRLRERTFIVLARAVAVVLLVMRPPQERGGCRTSRDARPIRRRRRERPAMSPMTCLHTWTATHVVRPMVRDRIRTRGALPPVRSRVAETQALRVSRGRLGRDVHASVRPDRRRGRRRDDCSTAPNTCAWQDAVCGCSPPMSRCTSTSSARDRRRQRSSSGSNFDDVRQPVQGLDTLPITTTPARARSRAQASCTWPVYRNCDERSRSGCFVREGLRLRGDRENL